MYKKLNFKIKALYNGVKLNQESKDNIFNFRRNIHRLEKGLTYKILKSEFAESYIYETVKSLDYGKNRFDEDTMNWGKAVLKLYFTKVTHTEVITKAYNHFKKIDQTFDNNFIPYSSIKRPESNITYDDLFQLSLKRRSVRYFNEIEIDEKIIKKAYNIAKYSPSACNRQAFTFYFYNDKKVVKALSAIPGGVQGYTLPSIIVIVGNYAGYFDERDINAPIIDASLTSMSFMYALETLGLSSVCINWPNLPNREKKIREVINLKPYEFVIMMLGVGYASLEGKIPYSAKRSANEVVLVNKKINNTSEY
ncbi:MAG: nitroreductase family protein [Spirochaetaceae bacterium]